MIAAGLAMMVLALAAVFMVTLTEQEAVEDRDQDWDIDDRAGDSAGERSHRR